MPRGGKREGAGGKKGFKFPLTLEKEKARKEMQAYILKRLEPLLQAQTSLARGLEFVYEIVEEKDSKGKVIHREHKQLQDPERIAHALDVMEGFANAEDGEYYYITAKAPDIRAIDSMIDRTFGKATQMIETDNPGQNEELRKINQKLKEMHSNARSGRITTKNTSK